MIVIDEEAAGWVSAALRESHTDQTRFREAEIKKLNAEHARLRTSLDTLYEDRIDGRIDLDFFERKSRQWRDEQFAIQRDIERHQTATESCMEAGVRIIELAQKLHSTFVKQTAQEKRRLLNFVVSNCSGKRDASRQSSASPLICWRLLSRRTSRSTSDSPFQLPRMRSGSPAWIRTTLLTGIGYDASY
jgi:site-specific DNA recombinase